TVTPYLLDGYGVLVFRILLVETPDNPFVAPVNIETIRVFMNKVGYQAVQMLIMLLFYGFMNNVKQKKEAIQYPRFVKLIIVDLMKKLPEIPKWIEDNYHSIKDDIPLVSVYPTEDVRVRGMLIPDVFLIEEIRATDDFKEYETVFMKVDVAMNQPQRVISTQGTHKSTPRAHRTPTLTASPQGKKRKQSVGESSSPQLGSHKDNPEHVDDDDKDDEKVDEEEGGQMGSLETRNEETQTTIPTPHRSPRTILSSDKNITQELMKTVSFPTTTTSNTPRSKRRISILHLGVSKLVEKATEELIETNLKPCIAATIIEDRDAFRSKVPDLVSQEFNAQAPKIIEDLFKNYVQNDKKDDDVHSHHDDHQEDDASPEGEKRVKRDKALKSSKSAKGSSFKHSAKDSITYVSKQQQEQEWDAWVEEIVIDEDEVIPKDETPELITEL
ncbi:hypothetical protein Tco_1282665, partial [Tanacetum coccineum]